jgi:DNA-3-methyladenine glycosylase II
VLSNEELKACYFSRQKIIYTKYLANELAGGQLNLDELSVMDNDTVRATLTKTKGIGNWTVDVYLMMAFNGVMYFH